MSKKSLWTDGISHVVGREKLAQDQQALHHEIYIRALGESRAIPKNVGEAYQLKLIGGNVAVVSAKDAAQFYINFLDWVAYRVLAREFCGLYYLKGSKTRSNRKYSDEITVGFTEEEDYHRFETDILMPAKLAK